MSTLNKVVMALAVVAVSLGAGIGYTVVVSGSAAAQEQGPLELHWTYDVDRRIVVCKPPECEGGPPFCCRIHKKPSEDPTE